MQPTSPNITAGNLVQGFLLYAGGLFLIGRAAVVIAIALSQAGWVATPAVVVQSDTSEFFSQERIQTSYHFAYEYTFNDELYESNRYSAAQLSPSEIEGVRQFSAGEPITVYVNPDNPRQAVVERRWPSLFVYFGFGLGLLALWFATGITFFGSIHGLNLVVFEQREAAYRAFGNRYRDRLDEPPPQLIPEMAAEMPRPLKKIVGRYIRSGNHDAGRYYLGRATGLPTRTCESLFHFIEHGELLVRED